MADYIFPLVYKPGFNRDGPDFQPDFCNDGQWIRFNEGKVKKIGGLASPGPIETALDAGFVSNLIVIPNPTNSSQVFVYLAGVKLGKIIVNTNFSAPAINKYFSDKIGNLFFNALWQSVVVIDSNVQKLLFFATNNSINISDNTKGRLFSVVINNEHNVSPTELDARVLNQKATGGICYAAPYLFAYGENGFVQWSTANNPLNFLPDNSITITNDKVIYAANVRGGTNSPSLLFWSTSKVIRVTNTAEGDVGVQLQVDVVSNNSSILSSRSVADYDGLFFWLGTDRFFVYNGVVQEVVNNDSINYFFNNIDIANRQKVFAVINPRFGEIWWYYPEKGQNQSSVKNTRALIYNKRENSWYDTKISRECGTFSTDLGCMVTYGQSLTSGTEQKYLWRHEIGVNEVAVGVSEVAGPIVAFNNGIPSFVTTPFISQAAFNAQSPMSGVDRFLELKRIEPDFEMLDRSKKIEVAVNTKRYAQSKLVSSDPYIFTGNTEKIDLREQGRAISFTFSSEHDFRMGNIMLLMASGDGN